MKHTIRIILLLAIIGTAACTKSRPGKPRVLVFTKTAGFHHGSIPAGIAAIQKLGQENGFEVDTTTNAGKFNEDTLQQYAAVIFLNTTGDVLKIARDGSDLVFSISTDAGVTFSEFNRDTGLTSADLYILIQFGRLNYGITKPRVSDNWV